jgi:hypothetical protein
MAQTVQKFKEACQLAQEMADAVNTLRDVARRLIDSHNGEDFSGANSGPYVNRDAESNIKGFNFTSGEYLAGVQFAMQMEALLTNQVPSQGDWKTVISHLRSAKG